MNDIEDRHGMRKTLGTLQGGRWLAASAVMFAHAVTGVEAFVGPSGDFVRAVASRGYLGVDFFFVLSGFIIFHIHATDPRSLGAVASFAWRRAVRIYVPYLPIVAGLILLYQLMPDVSATDREWSWVKSFTLLPVEGAPALSVAWTLVHEVVFYSLFALFYYGGVLWWGVAGWSLLILANLVVGLHPGAMTQTMFATINLEFVFGMLCAVAVHHCPSYWWRWLLPIGLFGSLAVAPISEGPMRLLFGFFISLVVVGSVLGEWEGRIAVPKSLIYLGGASYAIYLLHNPIVSVAVRVAAYLGAEPASALLACLVLGTAAGVIYTIRVDAPARRIVNDSVARLRNFRATRIV